MTADENAFYDFLDHNLDCRHRHDLPYDVRVDAFYVIAAIHSYEHIYKGCILDT